MLITENFESVYLKEKTSNGYTSMEKSQLAQNIDSLGLKLWWGLRTQKGMLNDSVLKSMKFVFITSNGQWVVKFEISSLQYR